MFDSFLSFHQNPNLTSCLCFKDLSAPELTKTLVLISVAGLQRTEAGLSNVYPWMAFFHKMCRDLDEYKALNLLLTSVESRSVQRLQVAENKTI